MPPPGKEKKTCSGITKFCKTARKQKQNENKKKNEFELIDCINRYLFFKEPNLASTSNRTFQVRIFYAKPIAQNKAKFQESRTKSGSMFIVIR